MKRSSRGRRLRLHHDLLDRLNQFRPAEHGADIGIGEEPHGRCLAPLTRRLAGQCPSGDPASLEVTPSPSAIRLTYAVRRRLTDALHISIAETDRSERIDIGFDHLAGRSGQLRA